MLHGCDPPSRRSLVPWLISYALLLLVVGLAQGCSAPKVAWGGEGRFPEGISRVLIVEDHRPQALGYRPPLRPGEAPNWHYSSDDLAGEMGLGVAALLVKLFSEQVYKTISEVRAIPENESSAAASVLSNAFSNVNLQAGLAQAVQELGPQFSQVTWQRSTNAAQLDPHALILSLQVTSVTLENLGYGWANPNLTLVMEAACVIYQGDTQIFRHATQSKGESHKFTEWGQKPAIFQDALTRGTRDLASAILKEMFRTPGP
jgi:hypothetical protein